MLPPSQYLFITTSRLWHILAKSSLTLPNLYFFLCTIKSFRWRKVVKRTIMLLDFSNCLHIYSQYDVHNLWQHVGCGMSKLAFSHIEVTFLSTPSLVSPFWTGTPSIRRHNRHPYCSSFSFLSWFLVFFFSDSIFVFFVTPFSQFSICFWSITLSDSSFSILSSWIWTQF